MGGGADKRARLAAAESEAEARGNGRLAELGQQLRAGGAGPAGPSGRSGGGCWSKGGEGSWASARKGLRAETEEGREWKEISFFFL